MKKYFAVYKIENIIKESEEFIAINIEIGNLHKYISLSRLVFNLYYFLHTDNTEPVKPIGMI